MVHPRIRKIVLGKKFHSKLVATLVFPCSLFFKSQFQEEALLEESDGTYINLSLTLLNVKWEVEHIKE